MKKLSILLFAVLLVFSLTACGNSKETSGGDHKMSKTLTVFNWSENMPNSVIKDFEKKYNVKVNTPTFESNEEMLTKLKSGAVSYDVVVPTDYIVERMRKQGLLAKLNMKNIPNIKNVDEEYLDRGFDPGNHYSIPYMFGYIGIAYNKKKVDKPESWSELWNPKYKGHLTLQENSKEVFEMTLQKLGYSIKKPNDSHLTKAKDSLMKLSSNVYKYTSNPAADLINGQAWISMSYNDQAAQAVSKNPDIEYILPKEGGILWLDNVAIPKNSKHKYTAEVFINYINSPKVNKKIYDAIQGGDPNKAGRELLDDKKKNNPASYPPKQMTKGAKVESDYSPALRGKINRMWQEIKVANN